MKIEHMTVTGLTCGGCVNSVTRALQMVDGIKEVSVSLNGGNHGNNPADNATVQYDDSIISPAQIRQAVENAGFGIAP